MDEIKLVDEHLTRQLDVLPMESLNRKITVIGAGAIGSFTVFALAKMGFKDITVYDFDTVEIENLNAQIYRHADLGKPKVIALKEIIKDFCGVDIKTEISKYENQVFRDIVICAVDNMEARKSIWNAHKERGIATNLLIDPRMAIEFAYIQCLKPMTPRDGELYEKTLFTDEQAVQERCTGKATVYTAQLIGGTIGKMVKDLATGKPYISRIMWDIGGNEVVECVMSDFVPKERKEQKVA